MAERDEGKTAERIDRLVADVLAGRHLKATPSDAADREAIQVAARLAGVRDGYPRMSPAFRRRLGKMLETGETPGWLNRRAALAAGLGLAAGAVGGFVASPVAGRLEGLVASRPAATPEPEPTPAPNRTAVPPPSRESIEPRADVGKWTNTGIKLADLVEGVPVRVTAGAVGAFLVRRGNQVVGMSSYCTHLPCELVWQADKKLLNCPCHNLAFDVDGQSMREGYPLPALPFVKVRVRNDGRVEVLGT
ncbi:MAG TPA: Rieske (2Fe-2S) protein [Candidatus Dormibacteraeota bacterium]|nr:Rieske (2Fe-2S) protein [Candidatus Dormibacteraeota bacterium]